MIAGEISKPDTCCPKIREYCTPPTDDPCPYASDDMCDVELGYCAEGSDLIDCGAALIRLGAALILLIVFVRCRALRCAMLWLLPDPQRLPGARGLAPGRVLH